MTDHGKTFCGVRRGRTVPEHQIDRYVIDEKCGGCRAPRKLPCHFNEVLMLTLALAVTHGLWKNGRLEL